MKRWIFAIYYALADLLYGALAVALGIVLGGLILWGILKGTCA